MLIRGLLMGERLEDWLAKVGELWAAELAAEELRLFGLMISCKIFRCCSPTWSPFYKTVSAETYD
jgi:hypothetical protein